MDKYEKLGGEEALKRSAEECEAEEIARLDRRPASKFDISYLRLLPALPDNVYFLHDSFGDGLILGQGTDEPPKAA